MQVGNSSGNTESIIRSSPSRGSWGRRDVGHGLLIELVGVFARSLWRHQDGVLILKSLTAWPKPVPKRTVEHAYGEKTNIQFLVVAGVQ